MNIANKNYLGAVLAGLAVIVFWILTMPIWDRMSLLNEAIAGRNDILASRKDLLKKVDELNAQYRERTSDVSKISSIVPSSKSAAELVSTLEAISQQSGMQLVEVVMSDPGDTQQGLQTVLFELGLIGNYPSLNVFLESLEKNLRLTDISEMSVTQASLTGAHISLNFRIKAKAYYLNVK